MSFYFPLKCTYFDLVLHSRSKTKRSLRSDVDRLTDRLTDKMTTVSKVSKVNVVGPPRHDIHKRIGTETKIK